MNFDLLQYFVKVDTCVDRGMSRGSSHISHDWVHNGHQEDGPDAQDSLTHEVPNPAFTLE